MNEARLKSIPLFASLSKRELSQVARSCDEVDVREGRALMTEGESAYEFFVIEEGTAEVSAADGRTLAQLGPGDFMGELGAMGRAKRSASVFAKSPMTVIVMTDRDLRHLEREMPSVHQQLSAAVDERTAALAAPAG
ncbi:MAG: cyclic nucleotide-binding domain-containing protein [Gaiellaceae bacterium]